MMMTADTIGRDDPIAIIGSRSIERRRLRRRETISLAMANNRHHSFRERMWRGNVHGKKTASK